jgi:predicted amidohydrolase YtcJ
MTIALLGLLLLGTSVQASHRVILFNQNAMDRVLEMWPDYIQTANNQARGMETPGQRGLITQSPLRALLHQLLREQPTPAQYGEGFKQLVREYYAPSGISTFASKLNTGAQVSAYHYMLRKDGRLPVRFAYSYDLARQSIPTAAAAGLYEYSGAMWDSIGSNPWLWLHGMAAEGDWDAPNRACMGADLAVKPGVDERQVKQVLEICPDFDAATVQALMRGIRSGWRFAGVHGVGSHAARLFIQKLEGHMQANPKVLTLDYVRNSRHGFAHGTMFGAVPDVIEGMVKYNLYRPINLRRALAIEPDNCRQNYIESCFDFLGPVKTLLDQGVKVVGEAEITNPTPETYFDLFDIYVNREIALGQDARKTVPVKFGEGEVYTPEEGVDRVVALKLFTYRSAEFLHAETRVGSLEMGKLADFIVTDRPFLSGSDREIRDNKVVLTVTAGDIRYQDPKFQLLIQ